ncbi:MAG: tRNA (adenosine(37)-N6)-dimethylallyltransferase MiaA [Candidatus Omnitrophota bacterium]|nr:tRNA (adenosine(37)-N6)-dimethylallyltransferase MiaA [Candidatus Omnitrophota bacterium]
MTHRPEPHSHPQPKIIFLTGPTAVGKTELSLKLARKINAEIISLDSMQVYQGIDILSSKPGLKQRREIKHHLIDILSPDKEFDAACYRRLAVKAIKDIYQKGKIPLFVGGTGLYLKVLLEGIFTGAGKDEALRQEFYHEAEILGSEHLHQKLKEVDKESAARIHPHDTKRIIRALEVYKLTGKPISELQKKRKGLLDKYEVIVFGLNKDREVLYKSIDRRVDEMFERGLVNEVKKLLTGNLSLTCKQAIGIREIRDYLEGKHDLEQAKDLLKKNTRNYAKRQLTWFRKDKKIIWLDADDKQLIKRIQSLLSKLASLSGLIPRSSRRTQSR